MLQPFTIADCVATNARSFPDRCAIEVLDPRATGGVEPVETWSYGRLWGRTEALADALGSVATGPHGPMAGLLLPNGADHAAAYLACQLVGAGFLSRLMHWSRTFGLSAREVVSTPGPMFHLSYGGLTLAQLVAGGRVRVMTASSIGGCK